MTTYLDGLNENIREMIYHVWASEYAEALPAAQYVNEILRHGASGLALADSSTEMYQAYIIAKLIIEVNRRPDLGRTPASAPSAAPATTERIESCSVCYRRWTVAGEIKMVAGQAMCAMCEARHWQATPAPARAADDAKLTKAQRQVLTYLANGETIGRANRQISYSVRTGLDRASYQSKTTELLVENGLVKEVQGNAREDQFQYRVLEITDAGRAALKASER